jgi:hypothetical protein
VGNDTAVVNLTWLPTIADFPYAESFEQVTNAGWQAFGENSSWQPGQPMNDIINTASDGAVAWVTGLHEDYQPNEHSFLLSPVFDFSAFTADPVITYDAWQVIAPEDSAKFCFTTDGGITWKSYNLMGDNLLDSEPTGWSTVTHVLEGLAGQPSVLFSIQFKADSTKHEEGIAFDNVFICSMLPELLPIPDTLVPSGETIHISVEIKDSVPSDITFYATSSNQALIPNENISIEGNYLLITPLAEAEGAVDITVYARAQCVNETSFQVTVARITSIDKPEADARAKVYPNPGPGNYQIEMKDEIRTVTLYNQEGKLMRDFMIKPPARKSFFIDITSYPPGLYYLHIETLRGISMHKLIKDR